MIAFTANGGAVATTAVLMVTYLIHLGHRPVVAAALTGLLGVLSVTGRLITTGLQTRLPAALIAVVIFAFQGVAVVLLPVFGHTVPGAIGCVLLPMPPCQAGSPSSPSRARPWRRWEWWPLLRPSDTAG